MKFFAALLLACAAMPAMATTNLVSNPSFESGFSGWQQFGNTGYTGTAGITLGQSPTDGLRQAYFGPVSNSGGIFQNIATVAGETYRVSFDMYAAPGGQQFRVDFAGQTLVNSSFSPGLGYTSFVYDILASAASSQLRFRTQHKPSYYLLDNVRVEHLEPTEAVPEPATWAMLIAGFGLVGASLRRRSAASA
jgi:hypothetical protein